MDYHLINSVVRKILLPWYISQRIFVEIVWLISEAEALVSRPNDWLLARRFYLRLNNVRHSRFLWVGRGLRLLRMDNLVLGERCALGDFVIIANHASIIIGDDFTGATGLHLDSGTHDPQTLQPQSLPIQIGDRVWCGVNVTILAGVSIGNDVVLGAGSVVCKNIPSNSLAVGVPAKVIKDLSRPENTELWTWARHF
jgi:maltose O-acetyltransferase